MLIKKQTSIVILMIFLTATLTGCDKLNTTIGESLINYTEIAEDEDYKQALEYQNENKLDENNYYINEEILTEPTEKESRIKVSFATNQYININYFSDENLTQELSGDECFLEKTDKIYAKINSVENQNSNLYKISEYRIYIYNAEKQKIDEQKQTAANAKMIYEIPSDFDGASIVIAPIGEYPDRPLSVRVFHTDDKGKKIDLEEIGEWQLNGKPLDNNLIKISGSLDYNMVYNLENEHYFYVSSSPKAFNNDVNKDGFVSFPKATSTDSINKYSVELHPYLDLEIELDKGAILKLNGLEQTLNTALFNSTVTWSSSKIKYGDTIIIETDGMCTITNGDYTHVQASKTPLGENLMRYTLKITQKTESALAPELIKTVNVLRKFDTTLDTTANHGIASYKLDGKEINGSVTVQEGQKLELIYKITDSDYKFQESNFIGNILSKEKTVEIDVTTNINRTIIKPDNYFSIIKK